MPPSKQPLLPDVGVIGLQSNRWTDSWQPRHYILQELSRYFRIVWVNPAPYWRVLVQAPAPFLNVERSPLPGLSVHSPDFAYPKIHKPAWIAERMAARRIAGARKRLVRSGAAKIVLYLWRPEYAHALADIEHDVSCYHIDDEYSFSSEEHPIPPMEAKLLAEVDQVFIHSPKLLEKKGGINPNTLSVPNGVEFELYATHYPEPADIAGIAHPRVGYTGWVKPQLDWDLVRALSARHPEWSFVFVGQHKPQPDITAVVAELSRRPNVHFLGAKTYRELAMYPQHFDVCIMPYRIDAYTNYIYPMKLHEYLASGRPAIGSKIASLTSFANLVPQPESELEWSTALSRALAEASPGDRAAAAAAESARHERQRVARLHDWSELARTVSRAIADRLGEGVRERLERVESFAR